LYNECLEVTSMHVLNSDISGYFITATYFIEIHMTAFCVYCWLSMYFKSVNSELGTFSERL